MDLERRGEGWTLRRDKDLHCSKLLADRSDDRPPAISWHKSDELTPWRKNDPLRALPSEHATNCVAMDWFILRSSGAFEWLQHCNITALLK
jgi:hypothetical protein